VRAEEKVAIRDNLPAWRETLRRDGRKLVVTNGCFDLLHAGHVAYLETARSFGDALLVGVNADASVRALKGPSRPLSVRALKGPSRPLNNEQDRALVLAALAAVDRVCIFQEVRATDFLKLVSPDVYVKGGDYTLDTLDQEERRVVESGGGKIVIVPFVPGKSTTAIIERMAAK
jgi:D-glycero-beta-D-manno-heptose 1-phosphate adenylyltransferase